MTRGGLTLYALAVLFAIWLGYLFIEKTKTMDEIIMTNEERITELRGKEKTLNDTVTSLRKSVTEKNAIIAEQQKEIANLKTLLDISRDKLTVKEQTIDQILRQNAGRLKEFKPLIDSLILLNLEQLVQNEQKEPIR